MHEIIITLAQQWNLGEAFLQWLASANRFCNSLVVRIMPGTPAEDELKKHWQKLGDEDRVLTAAESYSL